MWQYEKKLQYPVKIATPNPKYAQIIISQFGGPDGELAASMRYLSQRYSMPYSELKGLLTDIGTEELAHMEMVSAMVHQLTRNLSEQEIKNSGFDTYFVDIRPASIPSPPPEPPLPQPISRQKAIPLPICMRIWPRSKRHAPPMTTCCV